MSMIMLENDELVAELMEYPIISCYRHKGTDTVMKGGDRGGRLVVNGIPIPWENWQIDRHQQGPDQITYSLSCIDHQLSMDIHFLLEGESLTMKLERICSIGDTFETLAWSDLPLIVCEDPSYRYWREEWSQKQWDSLMGRGLYEHTAVSRQIRYAVPDSSPQLTIHSCFYNNRICCFVHSNYPFMPLMTKLTDNQATPGRSNSFSIMLNTYQYKVRDRYAPGLEIKVVFLADTNGDGKADECDYHLWLNRQYPAPDLLYKETIWYKIFCAKPDSVGTTFQQSLEIIRYMHFLTNGMPQLVYLVGWQYEGHDTGYPSLDRINPKLGTREELQELQRIVKDRYNCTVSFHINVDDSYREHPGWDEQVICRDTDGELMTWEDFNGSTAYHICHTKDVESGKVFKRLESMLELLPVERSIHLDAFRCTNCSWELDGFIGVMEELECGLKPILSFFKQRGIDVTTEAVGNLGIDAGGLFSGIWHMSHPQIYHGKLIGGGRRADVIGFGMGASLNIDIDGDMLGNRKDFIKDCLYLGAMLYKYYLEFKMLELRYLEIEQQVFVRFDGDVEVRIDKAAQRLIVKQGDVLIADGGDRFIPLHGAIYVYSQSGGVRTWLLPKSWQGSSIDMYRLDGDSKRWVSPLGLNHQEITIAAEPRIPLILHKKKI